MEEEEGDDTEDNQLAIWANEELHHPCWLIISLRKIEWAEAGLAIRMACNLSATACLMAVTTYVRQVLYSTCTMPPMLPRGKSLSLFSACTMVVGKRETRPQCSSRGKKATVYSSTICFCRQGWEAWHS